MLCIPLSIERQNLVPNAMDKCVFENCKSFKVGTGAAFIPVCVGLCLGAALRAAVCQVLNVCGHLNLHVSFR